MSVEIRILMVTSVDARVQGENAIDCLLPHRFLDGLAKVGVIFQELK